MRFPVAAACLLAAGLARAASPYGAAYLNEPASPRQAGMGGVALAGGEPLAAWSNPALLAGQEPRWSLALAGASRFGSQATYGLGAGVRLGGRWTGGLLVSGFSESAPGVDVNGNAAGSLARSTLGAGVGAAGAFGPARAGALVKLVRDDVFGDTASAVAADLGATVRLPDAGPAAVTLGAAARNLGGKLRPASAGNPDGEALPAEFRGGAACAIRRVTVGAEVVSRPAGADGALGVEWQVVRACAVRAGLDGLKAGQRGLTAGLTATWQRFGLDYAFATRELGATHRVGLSYGFTPAPRQAAPVAPAEGGLNVAVAALDAQGVSGTDAAVVADWMRNELVKAGVRVIERGQMERVLTEQALQQTGCTSSDCAVKLGKLLNAQRMVVGSLGKLLNEYVLSVRVINVETGQQVAGDTARAADVGQLETAIQDLGRRMAEVLK